MVSKETFNSENEKLKQYSIINRMLSTKLISMKNRMLSTNSNTIDRISIIKDFYPGLENWLIKLELSKRFQLKIGKITKTMDKYCHLISWIIVIPFVLQYSMN